MLALYFDGTLIDDNAAGGFIIQDHDGAMLMIGSKLLPHSSIPFAELIGVWLGLKYLISHFQTHSIWI